MSICAIITSSYLFLGFFLLVFLSNAIASYVFLIFRNNLLSNDNVDGRIVRFEIVSTLYHDTVIVASRKGHTRLGNDSSDVKKNVIVVKVEKFWIERCRYLDQKLSFEGIPRLISRQLEGICLCDAFGVGLAQFRCGKNVEDVEDLFGLGGLRLGVYKISCLRLNWTKLRNYL